MQAKDAFADNREAIYFSELLNKMFTISGTSKQGAESVMYNLTQAMASGVLRGQDLNAVMSNTPMILQQVADYLGVSMGEIRKLAAEGELSAQVVKEAVFAAADETEAKFANMPMTFAQVWQSIQNQLIMMFEPALMKLNEFLNDPVIQTAIDAMIIGLGYIAQVIGWLVDAAIWLANVLKIGHGLSPSFWVLPLRWVCGPLNRLRSQPRIGSQQWLSGRLTLLSSRVPLLGSSWPSRQSLSRSING